MVFQWPRYGRAWPHFDAQGVESGDLTAYDPVVSNLCVARRS
jgi:hypothetical protein